MDQSIAGDLPARGIGAARSPRITSIPTCSSPAPSSALFFTLDGGKNWLQLKGGLPTIAVRDLAIQKRENDLVVATFGRGFYVLDDYSPLRVADAEALREGGDAASRCKKALLYIEPTPLGMRGQGLPGRDASTPRPTRRSAPSSPTT